MRTGLLPLFVPGHPAGAIFVVALLIVAFALFSFAVSDVAAAGVSNLADDPTGLPFRW